MHIITNNFSNSYGPLLLSGKKSAKKVVTTTVNVCSPLTLLWCWNVAKVTESGMNGYCSVRSRAEHHAVWHLMCLIQTHKSKGKIKRMFIYYVFRTCFRMLAVAVILVSDMWCTCPRKTVRFLPMLADRPDSLTSIIAHNHFHPNHRSIKLLCRAKPLWHFT